MWPSKLLSPASKLPSPHIVKTYKSSSPTSPIPDSLMLYLELQSIHRSPLKLAKPCKNLEDSTDLEVRKPRTREARFAGLIPGRCVEIAAPFHAHCRQEAARNLSAEAPKVKPVAMDFSYGRLKCCSGHRKTGFSVDTEKPVIRPSTGVSPGLHPPCHGVSSNTNILRDTVSHSLTVWLPH